MDEATGNDAQSAQPSKTKQSSEPMVPLVTTSQLIRYLLRAAGARILQLDALSEDPLCKMVLKPFDPIDLTSVPKNMGDWNELDTLIYLAVCERPYLTRYTIKRATLTGFQKQVSAIVRANEQRKLLMDTLNMAIAQNFDGKPMAKLAKLVCQPPFTYAYSLMLMQEVAAQSALGTMMRQSYRSIVEYARKFDCDVSTISIAVERCEQYPTICRLLVSVVSGHMLSTGVVRELHRCMIRDPTYSKAYIMRDPLLADLLIDALFNVNCKLSQTIISRLIKLLAYITGTPEQLDVLALTIRVLHKSCSTSAGLCDTQMEMLCNAIIFPVMLHPVIGACMLRFIEDLLEQPELQSSTLHSSMRIIDLLATLQPCLQEPILHLLIGLFEKARKRDPPFTVSAGGDSAKTVIFTRMKLLSEEGRFPVEGEYYNLCSTRGITSVP